MAPVIAELKKQEIIKGENDNEKNHAGNADPGGPEPAGGEPVQGRNPAQRVPGHQASHLHRPSPAVSDRGDSLRGLRARVLQEEGPIERYPV